MLNIYPSPVECLIFRMNNNNLQLKEIEDKKDIKENESSRKILIESSIIKNSPQNNNNEFQEIELDAGINKNSYRENQESKSKISLESNILKEIKKK